MKKAEVSLFSMAMIKGQKSYSCSHILRFLQKMYISTKNILPHLPKFKSLPRRYSSKPSGQISGVQIATTLVIEIQKTLDFLYREKKTFSLLSTNAKEKRKRTCPCWWSSSSSAARIRVRSRASENRTIVLSTLIRIPQVIVEIIIINSVPFLTLSGPISSQVH